MHKRYGGHHYAASVLLILCIMVGAARADERLAQTHVPDAGLVGQARLTVLFWDVYDASLYAPEGKWQPNRPFALTLHYLRTIEGADIAERSAELIRQQGLDDEVRLAAWYAEMRRIFPDVTEGDELTGIYRPNAPTEFYQNGSLIGRVQDAAFGEWFFNIWLSEKSEYPTVRNALLGRS